MIAAVALAIGAIGCQGDDNSRRESSQIGAYTLPASAPVDAGLWAEATGPFHAELTASGACAWLGSRTQPFFWPQGYSVRFDPVELLDPTGRLVAHEGDFLAVA